MEAVLGDDNEPIIMRFKLKVGANPIGLPKGHVLNVQIIIKDEYEMIYTDNARFTQDLVRVEKTKPSMVGTIAIYSERNQSAIIKFPYKTKGEIAKIIGDDLKKMGVMS